MAGSGEFEELTTIVANLMNETVINENLGTAIAEMEMEEELARTPFEYSAFILSMLMFSWCIIGMFGNAMSGESRLSSIDH